VAFPLSGAKRPQASIHLRRIGRRGNRRKPPVRIKKSELPVVPREFRSHNSDAHTSAEVAIFWRHLKAVLPVDSTSASHLKGIDDNPRSAI
jgi:hypothetical protein